MAWKWGLVGDAFADALKWFRRKVSISKAEFDALDADAREKAFTVAGVAQLDIVTDVWEAVDKAVSEGETLDDFRKRVGDRLETAWGGEIPGRIETIFRTNVQMAYSAGREQQMRDPEVIGRRPYLEYDATVDSRTTPICRALHGTILRADDPFWQTRTPPCHFQCRATLISLTEEQAKSKGITTVPPNVKAMDGFGRPSATWEPDLNDYPPELVDDFERKQG